MHRLQAGCTLTLLAELKSLFKPVWDLGDSEDLACSLVFFPVTFVRSVKNIAFKRQSPSVVWKNAAPLFCRSSRKLVDCETSPDFKWAESKQEPGREKKKILYSFIKQLNRTHSLLAIERRCLVSKYENKCVFAMILQLGGFMHATRRLK